MANTLYDLGRQAFLDGSADWNTHNFKVVLVDLTDYALAVTGATNATPIVITTGTSHGLTTGHRVCITGITGNTAANGMWTVTVVDTDEFSLDSSVGNGAYSAGGLVVRLTTDQFLSDIASGGRVATSSNLTNPTVTNGVADADDVTLTAVTGDQSEAIVIYRDTGSAATSPLIAYFDGLQEVVCAVTTNSGATTLPVEALLDNIPSGTVLVFNNGASATLSSSASAGARTIAVNSTAATITAGNKAQCVRTSSGLPITPNGGNITITWPSTGIFKL